MLPMKFTFLIPMPIILFFIVAFVQNTAAQQTPDRQTFTDSKNAFRILLPSEPVKNNQPDSLANEWHVDNYSCVDEENQVLFLISVRSIKEGYYLPADSVYFEIQKENWEKMSKYNLNHEFFKKGKFAAMKFDMVMESEGSEVYMKTVTIIRGNRSYLLLAATDEANIKSPAIDEVFNSFETTDYLTGSWKTNMSDDQIFSAYTPVPITSKKIDESTEETTTNKVYYSYDSLTAVTYEVQKVSFTDYYSAKNDSMVFENALTSIKGYTDSVLSIRNTVNGADRSQEVLLQLANSQTIRRIRLVLHGDTVYNAYAFLHPELLNTAMVNRYFDEWKVLLPAAKTTLLTPKKKEFFADLSSGDSIRFNKAANALSTVEFEANDLPMLKEALTKEFPISEAAHSDLYNQIADLIYDLHKPQNGNTAEIVDFVKAKYFSAKVYNDAQPIAMLRLLAKLRTNESFSVIKDLILAKTPQSGSLYQLYSLVTDSLDLAASLVPDILKLSNNPLYYDFTASVANLLLDSAIIQKTIIAPYLPAYYKAVNAAIDTLKINKDAYVWQYLDFLHLVARMNTPEGNQLLQKIIKEKNLYLNKHVTIDLLRNKQKVDPKILEAIAESNGERMSMYSLLKNNKLLSFFPVKYKTQRFMAESDAYNIASDEYEVSKISFIAVKIADTKKGKKKFYLFRVKLDEEEWLVVSGGYELNETELLVKSENEKGGMYTTEVFYIKKVDAQFKAFLKAMEEF
jgi:hypothetical protein